MNQKVEDYRTTTQTSMKDRNLVCTFFGIVIKSIVEVLDMSRCGQLELLFYDSGLSQQRRRSLDQTGNVKAGQKARGEMVS